MNLVNKTSAAKENSTRFKGFQDLMRKRIRDVLLVSSLYDSYLFEEDGRLYELIRNEYQGLNLSHSPELTRVSSGAEGIALAKEENRFDLIITTLHIEDMHSLEFAKQAREAGLKIPIVLLAFDNKELGDLMLHHDMSVFDRVFIWQGDFHLIIAIIHDLEDRMNVVHDTEAVGVQSIILIEDNIRFYSSFLPLIYTEILKQSQRLISEGVNLAHRYLRMRARPKILLCTTYEEALEYYNAYKENILGVISDFDFLREGKQDPLAGLLFAKKVKGELSDVPILLQSNLKENERKAHSIGASFVLKESAVLLHEVRQFMNQYFSFGDFIFRTLDGKEVGRAIDLQSLEEQLRTVPEESLRYHGERNHFSNWLKARTEFWLAEQLRPRKVSDYASFEELRQDLISSLHEYRQMQKRGIITDFKKETFDPASSFARIGTGSLGGKARGLGFLNTLISNELHREEFAGVRLYVPPGVVIGTDVFDEFLDVNHLHDLVMSPVDDETLTKRFVGAENFPHDVLKQLDDFLEINTEPLAVRSSSLLEDSQYQPFAGVYETYMIPNNDSDSSVRMAELLGAIKRVYASTFYRKAKDYIKMTSYRLEEEKMAVIIQKMVGSPHGSHFYPSFAGVAKSHNFYPTPPQVSADGIVSIALGLGKTVVDGGVCVRFCPKYPFHLQQLSSIEDTLANNQHEFFALDLEAKTGIGETHDTLTKSLPLDVAEKDGTLSYVGSTYSAENDAVYDGISRTGMRLVTFSPILKNKLIPLPEILMMLMDLGSSGMGSPVEIEFAVSIKPGALQTAEFGVLQMRPLVISREFEELRVETNDKSQILCESSAVLGNGIIDNVCDILLVDPEKFNRARSQEVADEIGRFNARLVGEGKPYLLIGVGRWGTLDPWLGIPVRWDQISGARTIVESEFKDISVTPSQGSHFFQNLTAFMIGYFSIDTVHHAGFIDWDWLLSQKPVEETEFTRHLRFKNPVQIKMNGHKNKGIILKPLG